MAATAAQNLINGETINFPASQNQGVVPGQSFGLQPRLGNQRQQQQQQQQQLQQQQQQQQQQRQSEIELRGNTLEDAFSAALGDNFPVDRIPVQFRGDNSKTEKTHFLNFILGGEQDTINNRPNPNIQLKLKSKTGNSFGGRRGGGVFRKKKKIFISPFSF